MNITKKQSPFGNILALSPKKLFKPRLLFVLVAALAGCGSLNGRKASEPNPNKKRDQVSLLETWSRH